MKIVCSGEQAVTYLRGRNSLLDGELEECEIFQSNGGFSVDIRVRMRPSAEHRYLVVCLESCRDLAISHSDDSYFYNIERVKVIRLAEDDFYISLDPVDESGEVSDDDNDFFRSRDIHVFAVEQVKV